MHSAPKAVWRALLGAAVALGLAGHADAADFSGKTIEWIIPFPVAGGSDVWARFFAPVLAENLPGKPTVVVKNVPGAGSIVGTNQFQSRARPDGLMILGTSGSTQFPFLLQDTRVKYDYKNWVPVLASPTGGVVYINPTTGVKGPEDLAKLKGKKMKYGSQGATSLDLVPILAFQILGLDARLAYERGEAAIDYQTSSAYLRNVVPLVKAGKATPLFSWGVLNDKGEFVRDPTFPDLPHFVEFYEKAYGKKPSGIEFVAFKSFCVAGFAVQKLIFLLAGTPQDIIDAYVMALQKGIATPEFKEKSKAELGDYEQATGKAAEAFLKVALEVTPEARQWVRKWLTEKYNVKF
jgi:tripartite-type tricarboxylate transporter receptor subunit TctC